MNNIASSLYAFDQEVYQKGFTQVAGVDEAGRGPLAGPVVAAAVILTPDLQISGLNDSKKLTEKRRELLYDEIIQQAAAYSIAFADPSEIDTVNILNATFLAMKRSVEGLSLPPDFVLIDGNSSPDLDCPFKTVVKGDSKSAAIAAASILAKVARDRYMRKQAEDYPEYEFHRHKGYPTKLHYEMLDAYGPCPIHRKSFLRKWEEKQQ